MADKAISELIAATQITPTDLLVMEQNGTAKSISGQVMINFLTAIADGHGGIQSIELVSSETLKDTYRITLADTTTFDFTVTNGRGIRGVAKTSTEGLVDTYTVSYNDGTSDTITVTNGAKGETGDAWYVWVKYASQEPTAESHSFGDLPDAWMGVYSGTSATAPDDWNQYRWFEIKGQPGNTGAPATLVSSVVEYQASDSGTIIPSGSWGTTIPVVAQGRYLWIRITQTFNTGTPVVFYSVSRMGIDGAGSVSSVAGISPDADGNVPLTADSVGALPAAGGDIKGPINMNGQLLRGLNEPTADDEAANRGYVDGCFSNLSASDVGAAPAIESTDYPGCYYRVIDGVTEWLNPPMVLGVEYATTERYNGKTVYVKLFDAGTLPNASTKSVWPNIAGADLVACVASFGLTTGSVRPNLMPVTGSSGKTSRIKQAGLSTTVIECEGDESVHTCYILYKYTK